MAGALELAAAYKYFPRGTVFVVVVDPGVGSARRPIAAEAGGYSFVAPDNGVLTLVFKETLPSRVVELTERRYARPTVSRTFEGRDRFGPAAAWLAKGIDLSAFGRTLNDWQTLSVPEPIVTDAQMIVEVLRVDHFGNLVTNVDRRTFDRFVNAERIEIVAGTATVGKVVLTYADADPGALCALFGSSEHLEIAVNSGSAAERLGLGRGAKITVSKLQHGA
jgi:S-adenosylmethionine hydrolase